MYFSGSWRSGADGVASRVTTVTYRAARVLYWTVRVPPGRVGTFLPTRCLEAPVRDTNEMAFCTTAFCAIID
jgi:hypothetical protein